jgi:hypothetical protein
MFCRRNTRPEVTRTPAQDALKHRKNQAISTWRGVFLDVE